jgi:glycosyltransferase involved in cell wall biosynthesis
VDEVMRAVAPFQGLALVVIGDGPERPRLEATSRALGLQERVLFAGARAQDETRAMLAACDLFILNSTYEGLPHVVLEAQALGVPVIATAAGGTPEVVRDGETGVLIQPGDERALTAAILRLLRSADERKRLGTNGQKASSAWAFDALVEQTEAVLIEAARA